MFVSEASSNQNKSAFLIRKIHSLLGVIPVGVFLLVHLWTNASALKSQQEFDHAVREIQNLPFLTIIEVFGIFLPLLFHAVYGVKMALESSPNLVHLPYNRNWLYFFQRVSGMIALVFILFHLWEYRFQKATGNLSAELFYFKLSHQLSSTFKSIPFITIGYFIGVSACIFHFSNGLWGFCCSWGITISKKSQKISAIFFMILGFFLLLLSFSTIIFFATGLSLFH